MKNPKNNDDELKNAWIVMCDSRKKCKLATLSLLNILNMVDNITILDNRLGEVVVSKCKAFVEEETLKSIMSDEPTKDDESIEVFLDTDTGYRVVLEIKYPNLTKKESVMYINNLEKNNVELDRKEQENLLNYFMKHKWII